MYQKCIQSPETIRHGVRLQPSVNLQLFDKPVITSMVAFILLAEKKHDTGTVLSNISHSFMNVLCYLTFKAVKLRNEMTYLLFEQTIVGVFGNILDSKAWLTTIGKSPTRLL